MTFCMIALLWAIYGYSLAFTQGSTPFIGSFDRLFLQGLDSSVAVAATFSKGVYLPEFGGSSSSSPSRPSLRR
jgi:ammonium transporter, Amt family